MKKVLMAMALILSAVSAQAFPTYNFAGSPQSKKDASTVAQTGFMVNEAGLSYSTTYTLDVGVLSRISAQVNYTSVTFNTATFSDGQTCAGSLTISTTTALTGVIVQFGNKRFVAGTDFTVVAPASTTAANFISSFNATGSFPDILLSRSAGSAIVYATATLNGTSHCYNILASNYAKISTANMTGAVDPAYSIAYTSMSYSSMTKQSVAAQFYLASHGYTSALPLLYSANSATIGGLTDQTTYYAIPIDANNIQLATTSARARQGLYLTVTSTTTQASAHAPTLVPLGIAGTPYSIWQYSNDGVSFKNIPTASTGTLELSYYVYGSTTSTYDFGAFDYRYLRLNVGGPSAGAILLQAVIYGKD